MEASKCEDMNEKDVCRNRIDARTFGEQNRTTFFTLVTKTAPARTKTYAYYILTSSKPSTSSIELAFVTELNQYS